MSLHDLECLQDRPLFEELAVVLRALPVVAATDILGRKMSGAIPAPAARCRRIGIDRSCQLVMAAVADVAKGVEMAVLRFDESEPRVPERVTPVEGLEERRVDLTSAVGFERRLLPKTLDGRHVTADKPRTGCGPEHTPLSRRGLFSARRGPLE